MRTYQNLPGETALLDGKVVITPLEIHYPYGMVRFYGLKPSCVEHGAMNKVSADGGIWRCTTCHVGVQEVEIEVRRKRNYF